MGIDSNLKLVLIYIAFESLAWIFWWYSLQLIDLWQLSHACILLSSSTKTFGTNGTSHCSKWFKLSTHFLNTKGWFPHWFHPYDIIGYSPWCSRSVPPCFGTKFTYFIIIVVITDSSLILYHLLCNTFKINEISIVDHNLFSNII